MGSETVAREAAPASNTSDAVTVGLPGEKKNRKLPWEAPEVRVDVTKTYNLRIPEPYMLKLRYIAEHTPKSMQQFCLGVLLPAIDKELRSIEE